MQSSERKQFPITYSFKCSVAQNEDAESLNDQLTSVDLPVPPHPFSQEILQFFFVELLNC